MKGFPWKIGALLLAVLMLLNACAASTQNTTPTQDDATTKAQERIQALETELALLQERELEYKSQITQLQDRITQLSTGTPPSDTASESITFHYREESGTAVITGYSGNLSILTVPAVLNGLSVSAIGERAFEGCSLTAVILPEGITRIAWFAFYECQNLVGVTLPSSIKEIGYAVFDGCPLISLRCPVGSYAERYAQSYAIPYTVD